MVSFGVNVIVGTSLQFQWHEANTRIIFLLSTIHPIGPSRGGGGASPSQGSPEHTVLHRSTWCHTWELDTVGGVAFLTGDVCFVVLFSTGFFLVLLLFFWDFASVAVEGVTGNFTGLEDWFEDLKKAQESGLHSKG